MNKATIYNNPKDEWYTPISIIDHFRERERERGNTAEWMDPATTDQLAYKQHFLTFYTKESNGLDKEWNGNVWLNPPFSNKNEWLKKARDEVNKGNCKVFLLLPMSLETQVFHKYILGYAKIYIPNKRISFTDENGSGKSAPFGSAIYELTKAPNNTYETISI